MTLRFEQITVEKYVWDTIANPKTTRKDVATAYAMALASGEPQPWRGFNQAILERWSFAGLKFIKDAAWRRARKAGVESVRARRSDTDRDRRRSE